MSSGTPIAVPSMGTIGARERLALDALIRRGMFESCGYNTSRNPTGTGPSDGGMGRDGFDQLIERAFRPGASGPEWRSTRETTGRGLGDLEGAFDEFGREPEIDQGGCVAYISRGDARYQDGDRECEADYRTAFSLDAPLAALEIIRRLKGDIRDDLADVLLDCRERLRIDPKDVVARTRLGVTLLMIHRDDEGLCELQQVFARSAFWRPSLRLLVNEARRRRAAPLARALRAP
jgi:hypothetical protein